jgi:YfiH family protein
VLGHRLDLAGAAGRAHLAFTDRHGGYGRGAYASFNLAQHVGDDGATVAANRALLGQALGLDRVSYVDQVHGTHVHDPDADGAHAAGETSDDAPPAEADAQVTTQGGLGLAILVADCTPELLAAPDEGIVAAAHAGRRGFADGIVEATLTAMRERGATRIEAAIGPSIGPRSYEVPAPMRDELAASHPVTASVTRWGTPALDIAAGVVAQLAAADVRIAHWSRACTAESSDLFSYRRDGTTGRFAGVVWFTRSDSATRPSA